MSPERLLVVIDEMEVGGSQRQIVHLLTSLDRNRWQPELAYFRSDSFLLDVLRNSGIPTHYVPKHGRFDLRFLMRFARLLRQGDYALIHAFSLTAELWTVLAKRVSGCGSCIVASERNQYTDKPAWYWRLKRFILRQSAAVIANSEAGARATARRTRLPAEGFDTIPNGVEIPPPLTAAERTSLRAAIGVPPDRVFGLFVGRLVNQKNLPCLIRAQSMLDPAHRPWIALVGDGPLRESTQQQLALAGLTQDLPLLGIRSDAKKLMQAADFLVMPSHFEGQSNALLEAMAAGCPVIASAVGGTPELIEHDLTGLLFPDDDDGALAQCLLRLSIDSSLRHRLSQTALEHVHHRHEISAMVVATAEVYERCLRAAAHHLLVSSTAREDRKPASASKRLHVLMLLDGAYPPPGGGGTEMQVRTLAKAVRGRGHYVTVVTPVARLGPQERLGRVDGVPVCRLPCPRIRRIGGLWLMTRLALFLWSRRGCYDAWHIHSPRRFGATAVLFGSFLRKPTMVVKVASATELHRGNLASRPSLQARLAFACLRRADAWQAISQRIAAALASKGIPASRIAAIPNAVDLTRFSPVAFLQPIRPCFVFIGRLVPVKNLPSLLTAFAAVVREHSGARLQVIGTGPLESALKAQAHDLGIAASVEFLGHREDVEHLLRDADFGVLPSTVEGMSNTLLECMASGLPMIASRVSGSEDLVRTGVNGWLFEPNDNAGLTTCLLEAARLSPERHREMGDASRATIEQRASVTIVVERLLSLYRGCQAGTGFNTNAGSVAMGNPVGIPSEEH